MAKKMSKSQISKQMKKARERQNVVNTLRALNQGEKLRVNGKTYEAGKWRDVNISDVVGKKNWTEGQKEFARAIKTIEQTLGSAAADIKMKYGSDDIVELANEFYVADLAGYSEEELEELEEQYNQTHGYAIRIKQAKNPFENIDFFNM